MNTDAARLLELVSAIPKPLLAQHDFITSGTRYREAVASVAGCAPAIFGSDFSFCYTGSQPSTIVHCGPANLAEPGHGVADWKFAPERIFAPEAPPLVTGAKLESLRERLVQRCIELHRSGSLITLMWHVPRPGCGDSASDGDLWVDNPVPDAFWSELFDEASSIHSDWAAQVDRVASHLRSLQEEGVPVLWRPYHEMNGRWFWWGKQPAHFGRLWQMLRDRLEHRHNLQNLVWVWNPNSPRETAGDEADPFEAYYPGSSSVDILAVDVYHRDFKDSHYTELLALGEGKPIALGEVGHLPDAGIFETQPRWAWIMPWGGLLFRFNTKEEIQHFTSRLAPHPGRR